MTLLRCETLYFLSNKVQGIYEWDLHADIAGDSHVDIAAFLLPLVLAEVVRGIPLPIHTLTMLVTNCMHTHKSLFLMPVVELCVKSS